MKIEKKLPLAVICVATVFAHAQNAESLYQEAENYYYGKNGYSKDYHQAAQLHKQSCDDGYADSCFRLGNMYNAGQGVRTNEDKAADFFEKACGKGNGRSCNSLAAIYEKEGNISEASRYYQMACGEGIQRACEKYRDESRNGNERNLRHQERGTGSNDNEREIAKQKAENEKQKIEIEKEKIELQRQEAERQAVLEQQRIDAQRRAQEQQEREYRDAQSRQAAQDAYNLGTGLYNAIFGK
jgi:hypothetical protein